MVTIIIPGPIRAYTGGQRSVDVSGNTVGDALESLVSLYPGIRPHIYDEHGILFPSIHIFLKDQDVSNLQSENTPINNGDRLIMATAISGG